MADTRSPRIAPPESGCDGSLANTAMRPAGQLRRKREGRSSMRVDLPAPPGPATPTTKERAAFFRDERELRGERREGSDSAMVIARAKARSPLKFLSSFAGRA